MQESIGVDRVVARYCVDIGGRNVRTPGTTCRLTAGRSIGIHDRQDYAVPRGDGKCNRKDTASEGINVVVGKGEMAR